jgi:hypothetical protein
MPISPTAEGFRTAIRRPSLTLAEITWRWTTGAVAMAVFLFGLVEYLDSLPVTRGERFLLSTRHPYLIAQAIAQILRGTLGRVVMAALPAAILLGGMWIVVASVGRIATVRALLEYFRDVRRGEWIGGGDEREEGNVARSPFAPLLKLNALRAAVTLASVLGLIGAAILARMASTDANPQPGLAFFLFVPLAGVVWLAWGGLNWLLSLAGVFAVRDGTGATSSLAAAVALCRDRTGAVAAVSSWIGLAHVIAFVGASIVVSVPIGFAALVPWRLIALGVGFVTLVYYALADWLYVARLAGYMCIAEMPGELANPVPRPMPPAGATPVQTSIDRDELILSDLPAVP